MNGFCTLCSKEIDFSKNYKKCIYCGNKITPCLNKNQVTVSINLQELRILCSCAEKWATEKLDFEKIQNIYGIVNRIRKQLGENDIPLTEHKYFIEHQE